MAQNLGFSYIWTSKKKNTPDYHRGYAFVRTNNPVPRIYIPNINLINKNPLLNKLKNNPASYTIQNRRNIINSLVRRNIRPYHVYIMARNTLLARENSNLKRPRRRSPKTEAQIASSKKVNASHNFRLRQWQELKNIGKALIYKYRPNMKLNNASIDRSINNLLRPINFRSVNVRKIKNNIPAYSVKKSNIHKQPGAGSNYYNALGRKWVQ
jgi:hypothetical protein